MQGKHKSMTRKVIPQSNAFGKSPLGRSRPSQEDDSVKINTKV